MLLGFEIWKSSKHFIFRLWEKKNIFFELDNIGYKLPKENNMELANGQKITNIFYIKLTV